LAALSTGSKTSPNSADPPRPHFPRESPDSAPINSVRADEVDDNCLIRNKTHTFVREEVDDRRRQGGSPGRGRGALTGAVGWVAGQVAARTFRTKAISQASWRSRSATTIDPWPAS